VAGWGVRDEAHTENPKFVHLNARSLQASVELSLSTVTASKIVCFGTKRDVCGVESSEGSSRPPGASVT
jgi:hypothetical protein